MDKCDFTFRGERLSSRGYILCEFDGSHSVSAVPTDSQREFTSISMFNGKRFPILFSKYNEAFVAEMYICKNNDSGNYVVPAKECESIKRWLCSPTANEFRLCDTEYANFFWNGSFNVEEMHSCGECVGFHLTFTSTAPFGFKNTVVVSGNLTQAGSVRIDDTSDEEGFIYPDITITVKSPGDLRVRNSFDGRETVIRNCSLNETISFSHLLQISSSNKSHIIGDDFNFKFIRIGNTYNNTVNDLTFNLPCDYSISYSPIAKVVI